MSTGCLFFDIISLRGVSPAIVAHAFFFFVGIHPRVHNLSSDIIHCGSTSATLCLQVAAPQHNDHNTDHRPCSAKQKIVINFLFAYLLLPFAFYCRSLYLKLNEKINEQPSLNLLQTH